MIVRTLVLFLRLQMHHLIRCYCWSADCRQKAVTLNFHKGKQRSCDLPFYFTFHIALLPLVIQQKEAHGISHSIPLLLIRIEY